MKSIQLRDKLGSSNASKLAIIGKIIISISIIYGILGGLYDIIQGFYILYYAGTVYFSFGIFTFLIGAFGIVMGYSSYLLLNMTKTGKLVSLAKFFATLGAAISLLVSPIMLLFGLILLLPNPLGGLMLILLGIVFSLSGLSIFSFLDERNIFQKNEIMKNLTDIAHA